MDYKLTDFLPTTKKECELRGWDELDVILFSGDAYVDHPSFGAAILGRILEANGYRVAIESMAPGDTPKKRRGRPSFLKSRKSPCQSGCGTMATR